MNPGPWITTQLHKPRHNTLTRAAEMELFKALRAGDESARTKIVNANMKFLVSVASMYVNRGVVLEDLIAEGAMGLMEAVKRFDYATGNKFISYAVWWIRQTILTALGHTGRVIKLPPHRLGIYYRLGQSRDRLFQALEREPSVQELAEAAGLTEADVMESVRYCAAELSLDFENEEGETSPLEAEGPLPDHTHESIRVEKYREALLSDLPPRDQEILTRAYGIKDGVPMTMEEIGKIHGVTRELIRQRRNKALDQVRRKAKLLESKAAMEAVIRRNMLRQKKGILSIGEAS